MPFYVSSLNFRDTDQVLPSQGCNRLRVDSGSRWGSAGMTRGTGIAQAATCHAGLDPASTHAYQLSPERFVLPNLTRQFKEDTF